MDEVSARCDSVRIPFIVKNNFQEQLDKYYASSTTMGSRGSADSLKVDADIGSVLPLLLCVDLYVHRYNILVVFKPPTCCIVHMPNRLETRVKSKGFAFRHHGVPRGQVSSTDNGCVGGEGGWERGGRGNKGK